MISSSLNYAPIVHTRSLQTRFIMGQMVTISDSVNQSPHNSLSQPHSYSMEAITDIIKTRGGKAYSSAPGHVDTCDITHHA